MMAHSWDFGRRELNRRRIRIKYIWEVVLVLVVVATDIVITTVAAIEGIDLIQEESRFLSFDESLFGSDDREDSDSEEDSDEHMHPLFNFDDIENRFSSSLPPEDHKNKHETQQNYYTGESRKQQNYGILGSGNFEIIRGGIYTDEEPATNSLPNYSKDQFEQTNKKSQHSSQTMQDSPDSNNNGINSNEDNDDLSQFTAPFNFEFFSANPVIGFQGYNTFGASSIKPTKNLKY